MSNSHAILIRSERPEDSLAIRRVLEAAFPSPTEARLVELLREAGALHPSLVASRADEVIGHIGFSRVQISSSPESVTALGLAPLAVSPDFQRQGVGSELVREGLAACREAACDLVFVLGEPQYYSRFGFGAARQHDLHCSFDAPADAFMVAELRTGALKSVRGFVRFRPEFDAFSAKEEDNHPK